MTPSVERLLTPSPQDTLTAVRDRCIIVLALEGLTASEIATLKLSALPAVRTRLAAQQLVAVDAWVARHPDAHVVGAPFVCRIRRILAQRGPLQPSSVVEAAKRYLVRRRVALHFAGLHP